ncbi:hypothetical protein P4O66_018611 [Electrophorus voltai]|uniref:Uncharacterized protein n=1 Tax=Electrophorus voltai TaxID=2609070 RepID=A0AAD8YSE8_9TELE|nr:hypothetical protein P4O66_018611 [Electrophorus voltai]
MAEGNTFMELPASADQSHIQNHRRPMRGSLFSPSGSDSRQATLDTARLMVTGTLVCYTLQQAIASS